jgi:outer membrane protein OmpA-like peptidoglycan-associated protein
MKQYLVEALAIPPSQIDARGRGSTKFVVPPRPVAQNASQVEFDMEIERERSNRRVEVTINTNPQ